MSFNSVDRTAEIARQLSMKSPSSVASGHYLRVETETKHIWAGVFHRGGFDCVDLEGTGKKMRQWVIENDARWRSWGFLPHQPDPSTAKNNSTYIQEFSPLPNGKIDPKLRRTYQKILSHFKT